MSGGMACSNLLQEPFQHDFEQHNPLLVLHMHLGYPCVEESVHFGEIVSQLRV